MKFKDITLTKEQNLNVLIDTGIEILKDSKNSELGKDLVKWSEERTKDKLISDFESTFNYWLETIEPVWNDADYIKFPFKPVTMQDERDFKAMVKSLITKSLTNQKSSASDKEKKS